MTLGPLAAQYDLLCLSHKGVWSIIRADVKIKTKTIKAFWHFGENLHLRKFPALRYIHAVLNHNLHILEHTRRANYSTATFRIGLEIIILII